MLRPGNRSLIDRCCGGGSAGAGCDVGALSAGCVFFLDAFPDGLAGGSDESRSAAPTAGPSHCARPAAGRVRATSRPPVARRRLRAAPEPGCIRRRGRANRRFGAAFSVERFDSAAPLDRSQHQPAVSADTSSVRCTRQSWTMAASWTSGRLPAVPTRAWLPWHKAPIEQPVGHLDVAGHRQIGAVGVREQRAPAHLLKADSVDPSARGTMRR